MLINQKILKFFIFLFCFSIYSSISQTNEGIPLKNLAISKIPKPISPVIFKDFLGKELNLKDYHGKLIIINFWATWCAPCKREMPSLDQLYQNKNFKNLEVFAINVEEGNTQKAKNFFENLDIEKLEVFFDYNLNFVNEFKLRGVPTTVLINKKGEEFARIIGEVDFENKKFVKWLLKYD
jgi:thiol-disulfide isomerase/thioredoxin